MLFKESVSFTNPYNLLISLNRLILSIHMQQWHVLTFSNILFNEDNFALIVRSKVLDNIEIKIVN